MSKEQKEKPIPDTKVQNFGQSLRVQLTPDEVADRADRAACKIAERDDHEAQAKAAQKHAKSTIEQYDAEIRNLSNEVRNRSTYRTVECERQYDYRAGMYREIRLDTGEVVLERRLTAAESQPELPFLKD